MALSPNQAINLLAHDTDIFGKQVILAAWGPTGSSKSVSLCSGMADTMMHGAPFKGLFKAEIPGANAIETLKKTTEFKNLYSIKLHGQYPFKSTLGEVPFEFRIKAGDVPITNFSLVDFPGEYLDAGLTQMNSEQIDRTLQRVMGSDVLILTMDSTTLSLYADDFDASWFLSRSHAINDILDAIRAEYTGTRLKIVIALTKAHSSVVKKEFKKNDFAILKAIAMNHLPALSVNADPAWDIAILPIDAVGDSGVEETVTTPKNTLDSPNPFERLSRWDLASKLHVTHQTPIIPFNIGEMYIWCLESALRPRLKEIDAVKSNYESQIAGIPSSADISVVEKWAEKRIADLKRQINCLKVYRPGFSNIAHSVIESIEHLLHGTTQRREAIKKLQDDLATAELGFEKMQQAKSPYNAKTKELRRKLEAAAMLEDSLVDSIGKFAQIEMPTSFEVIQKGKGKGSTANLIRGAA